MRFASLTAILLASSAALLVGCPGEAEAPARGRPCVDAEGDALAKMRAHFHLSEEATAGFSPSPTKVDLDHDGQADHIYTFELNNESYTLVYAMKSACGEPMGAIPGPVTTLKTATRGFLDLKVTLDSSGTNWKICKVGEDGYRCAEP